MSARPSTIHHQPPNAVGDEERITKHNELQGLRHQMTQFQAMKAEVMNEHTGQEDSRKVRDIGTKIITEQFKKDELELIRAIQREKKRRQEEREKYQQNKLFLQQNHFQMNQKWLDKLIYKKHQTRSPEDKDMREDHENFEVELNNSKIPLDRKRRLVDDMNRELNTGGGKRSPDARIDVTKFLKNYKIEETEGEEQAQKLAIVAQQNQKKNLKAIMRKRKIEELNNKKQTTTSNDLMNEEFTKYRGKDMFTPKEPYLNCVLYDEIPHKTQVRNSPARQRKQAKIKSVPADNIKGIMSPLKIQKQSTALRFVTDDSSRFDSKRNSKGSDTQGSKTAKSRKRNLSIIQEEAFQERKRKELARERRQSKMILKKQMTIILKRKTMMQNVEQLNSLQDETPQLEMSDDQPSPLSTKDKDERETKTEFFDFPPPKEDSSSKETTEPVISVASQSNQILQSDFRKSRFSSNSITRQAKEKESLRYQSSNQAFLNVIEEANSPVIHGSETERHSSTSPTLNPKDQKVLKSRKGKGISKNQKLKLPLSQPRKRPQFLEILNEVNQSMGDTSLYSQMKSYRAQVKKEEFDNQMRQDMFMIQAKFRDSLSQFKNQQYLRKAVANCNKIDVKQCKANTAAIKEFQASTDYFFSPSRAGHSMDHLPSVNKDRATSMGSRFNNRLPNSSLFHQRMPSVESDHKGDSMRDSGQFFRIKKSMDFSALRTSDQVHLTSGRAGQSQQVLARKKGPLNISPGPKSMGGNLDSLRRPHPPLSPHRNEDCSQLERISEISTLENLDTRKFFSERNINQWKSELKMRTEQCLQTSYGLQQVDDFKGRFLKNIYDHNLECERNYEEVANEASLEFQKSIEPPLKQYALQKMQWQKRREQQIEKKKVQSIQIAL